MPGAPTGAAGVVRRRVVVHAAVLAAGVVAAGAVPARAQAPVEPRVTLALVSVTPGDALDRLAAASGISVVADAQVLAAAAGRRVSCRADAAAADEVLRCIVRDAGLDFYRLSSGTYVVVGAARAATRPGVLAGVVVDAVSGEPLPQARLTLAERSETRPAGVAGAFGFGGLAPGRYRLLATAMGYAPYAAEVEVGADGTLRTRVALRPLPVVVAPVVVNGIAPLPGEGRVGADTVPAEVLARALLYGGSILSAAAPGLIGVAQRSSFGDLHIQGGASGEQLIRIDGAPVFDPVSLGRMFGGVAPLAVGRLTVHKAGFGARVGSAAGSVVDLTHALGDEGAPPAAVAQADPYSATARLTAGWRAGGVPVSVMAAGRTSVWGVWRAPALDRALRTWNAPDPVLAARLFDAPGLPAGAAAGASTLGASDLHLAVRARTGAFHTAHASVYRGAHAVGSEWVGAAAGSPAGMNARDRYAWRTTVAQARLEGLAGAGLAYTVRLRGSAHQLTHRYGMLDAAADGLAAAGSLPHEGNRVTEVALEATAERAFGAAWQASAGAEAARTASALDMRSPLMRALTARAAAGRATAWGEVRRRLGARTAVEAGLRLTTLEGGGGRALAEPRVAVRGDGEASALGRYAWRVAAGGYRQFVPEFDVAAFGPSALVPSVRFWLPATAATGVPRATHLAAELAAEPADGWLVRAEGYARRHPALLAFDYGALAGGAGGDAARDPRAFVGGARGYAYGAGARVARAAGRGRAELGYDYGQSRRTFPSRFDGAVQPVPWNEPHRAQLALDLLPAPAADAGRGAPAAGRAGAGFGATLRLRGTWGRTWALRQAYYDLLSVHGAGVGLPIGRPGAAPRPALYEVDAGVTWARRVAGVRAEVGASVLDLFGRRSALDYALAPAPGGGFARVRRPALGAQPALTARVAW